MVANSLLGHSVSEISSEKTSCVASVEADNTVNVLLSCVVQDLLKHISKVSKFSGVWDNM